MQLHNAEIIRNPFNVAMDALPNWPLLEPGDDLRLCCVGRLEPSTKGQDLLMEALAHPSWEARRWRLTLYGDGPTKNGLELFSRRLGLADRVVFFGHTNSLEEIWSQNHLLVVPSRYEGLPIVIVEAMMCDLPVVATNVVGISEVIEKGITVFLAETAKPDSIRFALEQAWVRRSELEKLGIAAAESIRKLVPADPAGIFAEKLLRLSS